MPVEVGTEVRAVGWHCWPGASAHRRYLADLHRHLFHVRVEVAVAHDDRSVEFHDLAESVRDWWGDEKSRRDRGSCEAMASALADHLAGLYGTPRRVQVGEDGESWATWTPDGA